MQLLQRPILTRVRALLASGVALVALGGGVLAAGEASGATTGANVLFILPDDMSSSELAGMPNVESLIAGEGTPSNEA
jgi:hypothetical protein